MTDLKGFDDIMHSFSNTVQGCKTLIKYRFRNSNDAIVTESECLKYVAVSYLIKCKEVGNTTSECLGNMNDFYNNIFKLKE